MMTLILAESSLELVPPQIRSHISVTAHAKRLGRDPGKILLDTSWHYAAMRGIKDAERRGRPDIAHVCLQNACSTPLYLKGHLRICIHTATGKTIMVGRGVRLPKAYHRFEGLMSKLLLEGSIEYEGSTLLSLRDLDFAGLIAEIRPSVVVGLSTLGEKISLSHLASKLDRDSCVVVGGFQRGHFAAHIRSDMNAIYCIDEMPLEAQIVVGRLLYEYEKTVFM